MSSQVKYLEIRDRATFIPVVATLLAPTGDPNTEVFESYLLHISGFRQPFVLVTKLTGMESHYRWTGCTMGVAHEFINDHWNNLTSGDVIDVEFLRGESKSPKISQRLEGTNE